MSDHSGEGSGDFPWADVDGPGVLPPAFVDADGVETPAAALSTGATVVDYVDAIRAELVARGVPKSADALEAILVIDGELMSHSEFERALEAALDRGAVERTEDGLVPAK